MPRKNGCQAFFQNTVKLNIKGKNQGHHRGQGGGILETVLFHEDQVKYQPDWQPFQPFS
jgi:hypothetical protein